MFIARATPAIPPATSVHARPSATNSGVPGGCGMPIPYAAAMNSPASQKVTPGAIVLTYTAASTAPVNQPT
jgi:hypothetical protein